MCRHRRRARSLSAPLLGEHSLTARGRELSTLAQELSRCSVTSLVFLPETNLGELDALARLLNATSLKANAPARSDTETKHAAARETSHEAQRRDWRARLDEQRISSIHVNRAIHRKVDPALASLTAALLAYGGASHSTGDESAARDLGREPTDYAHIEANFEELTSALRLLRRMIPTVDPTQPSSPQETARALHAAMAEAERRTVSRLVAGAVRLALREEDTLESYVARLTDALVLEFVDRAFRAGCVMPRELRPLLERAGRELVPRAERATSAENPASGFRPVARSAPQEASPVLSPWADEFHAERLHERFSAELPARDVSPCCAARTLRLALESLSEIRAKATRRFPAPARSAKPASSFAYGYAQQTNLTIEQQLAHDYKISLSYTYTHGLKLNRPRDLNSTDPRLLALNYRNALAAGLSPSSPLSAKVPTGAPGDPIPVPKARTCGLTLIAPGVLGTLSGCPASLSSLNGQFLGTAVFLQPLPAVRPQSLVCRARAGRLWFANHTLEPGFPGQSGRLPDRFWSPSPVRRCGQSGVHRELGISRSDGQLVEAVRQSL